ncbi:MAG: hypothetical protein AAGD25_36205 [Cyanobacteria bacterium P01_F01_bin.150]
MQPNASAFRWRCLSVRSLFKSSGIGLLHTIGPESSERIGAWIDKYIFPGGYAPQMHELA